MRDDTKPPVRDGRVFEQPVGYGNTQTERLPVLGGQQPGDRTETDRPTDGWATDARGTDGQAAARTKDERSADGRSADDRAADTFATDGRAAKQDAAEPDAGGRSDTQAADGRDAHQADTAESATPASGTTDTPAMGTPAAGATHAGVVPTQRTADQATAGRHVRDTEDGALFDGDAVTALRARWRELQADFVDDPMRAVRGADELVDEVMRTLAERKKQLSGQWQGSEQGDTEELRLALRKYRRSEEHTV